MKTLIISIILSIASFGCSGPIITQKYLDPYATGGFHIGVDIAGSVGTAVRAPAPGKVAYAHKNDGIIAARIIIDHTYQGVEYQTLYYHLADPLVNSGDLVQQGQIIARLDLTGVRGPFDHRVIGIPHLHLEVYKDGRRGDPEKLLPWACPSKDRPQVDWLWPVGC
jgi:murein DD-endopeptidase MepM/ murein hydrolase activator NlpD